MSSKAYSIGPFRLDPESQALFRNAEPLALSQRAVTLLSLLVEQPGQLVTKDRLIAAAWNGLAVEDSNLTVQIASLRKVLGVEPGGERWIETMPRRGYRFVGPVASNDTKSQSSAAQAAGPPPLPDKPSLVVLPFQNLSGDTTQDYFVEGLVDDLTVALGCEKWLFVIAGPSARAFKGEQDDPRAIAARLGVRYVLRGSFRRAGDQVRIVVHLTDALHGQQIWSERFEDQVDNVFDMQDRLAAQVAATIAPALRSTEIERAQRKPTESLTAFDLYLQALPRLRTSLADNRYALELLDRAIALDPAYSAAYALASRCYQFQLIMGWVPRSDPSLETGIRLGQRAVELGNSDSEALWMAGLALIFLDGQVGHGQALIGRSLRINPNASNTWTASCMVHTYVADYETAIDHFNRGQRLNPLDTLHHLHWNLVSIAYFGSERYDDAIDAVKKCLKVGPAYPPALLLELVISGWIGRSVDAAEALRKLLSVHPRCTVSWVSDQLSPVLRRNPDLLARFLGGARRGGLPE
jgi:TolB-like protein/tetratricopeptide (TPR) repeat protein